MTKRLIPVGPSGPRSLERLRSWRKCPQFFAYRYLEGMDFAAAKNPLVRGTLIHQGLAHHAIQVKIRREGGDPDEFYDPLTAMALRAHEQRHLWGEYTEWILDRCQKVIHAFMEEDGPLGERHLRDVDILHVEQVFSFQVGPHTYDQKPDLVVRSRVTGKIHQWDHKSHAHPTLASFKRYATDIKFVALGWWGERLWGKDYGGPVIFSVGITEPYQFVCKPSEAVPFMIQQFPQMCLDAEQEIAMYASEDRAPRNYPKTAHEEVCFGSYGACDAREICRWGNPPAAAEVNLVEMLTAKGREG